jgi:hypothetical protein
MSATATLNQLMKDSAQDAVNFINENQGRQITICQDDLDAIDLTLSKLAIEHIQSPLSQEKLYTACTILGAYIGELFKQTVGGEWFMDESIPDAPFVVLNYAGKSFPFASVCHEKIVHNQEISVVKYYELALGGLTQ